jgi:asparagine synthase (glutamine-hydrolysing)
MCGICGVVQVGGGEPRAVIGADALDRMTDAMTHRGPSDRGTYTAPGVALGVRRLSIVDVDGGHQPVSDERGSVWAIQNGELYNHRDLRRELSGHRFASECDTEILPHLYEEHGPRFPTRLRGMFGIAVWDEPRRRLVLVRDRLGIKPLYHTRVGDRVVFASELKALLASGLVGVELDYTAIDAYLTLGYFPAPMTPLAGVSKLLPGHTLVIDEEVTEEPFWRFPVPDPQPMSMDDAAAQLAEKLDEAVRLRLMSDVPLGAMLSGGLDSSLIVALMARHMSQPVKTFSVGFAEDRHSELADAREVAAHLGADHTELELSFHDAALTIDELVWHLDEPVADLSPVGFHALCGVAARDVTVALSGQGADELLGGYRKHRAAAAFDRIARLPRPARAGIAGIAARGPGWSRRAARALRSTDPVSMLMAMSADLEEGATSQLRRGPLAAMVDGQAARDVIAARLDGATGGRLPVTLYLDAQLALVDLMLHYFDRNSMAHSLEVRVPFIDHELVEFCARIPPDLKVRRGTTKAVLRHVARGILPDRIIDKPKVGFFVNASEDWLRSQLQGSLGEQFAEQELHSDEFLDRDAVNALLRSFRDGGLTAPRARAVLSIVMLESWLGSYLPRALSHATPSVV